MCRSQIHCEFLEIEIMCTLKLNVRKPFNVHQTDLTEFVWKKEATNDNNDINVNVQNAKDQ